MGGEIDMKRETDLMRERGERDGRYGTDEERASGGDSARDAPVWTSKTLPCVVSKRPCHVKQSQPH